MAERELLPPIPGHSHTLDAQGRPTCGCCFVISDVDLAKYAAHVDDIIAGLERAEPITISGVWNGEICSVCQQVFTPGPEGAAMLTNAADEPLGWVCPACGTSMAAPREPR